MRKPEFASMIRRWIAISSVIASVECPHSDAFAQSGISLLIPPGARQNAMGEAGVALFGEASDAAWMVPVVSAQAP